MEKSLLGINFDSEPVYGGNVKYIKKKKKNHMVVVLLQISGLKICQKKYESKKIKMENLIDDDLAKSSSDESDNDSNDKTESDNKKGNVESKE